MLLQYLIIITILGWGIGSVFYKIANDNIHPIMVSAIVTMVYLVITPITFFSFKFPKDINQTGVIFSVLAGVCMAVGSLAYFFALRKGEAGQITIITALSPALTLLLSIFFLQEKMTVSKSIGVAFAILSFFILSQK